MLATGLRSLRRIVPRAACAGYAPFAILAAFVAIPPSCKRDPIYEERSTEEWIVALDDTSMGMREMAAFQLARTDPLPPRALRALVHALGEEDATVRANLMVELIRLGRLRSGITMSVRLVLSSDPRPVARVAAARVLGGMGPNASGAVPTLVAATRAHDPQLRAAALIALGEIGRSDGDVMRAFMRSIGDTAAPVRATAIEALGKLGAPEMVMLAVERGLRDDSAVVRENAAYAAASLGSRLADVVPALLDALVDSSLEVRAGAAYSLGRAGPMARLAVPALERALADSSDQVRDMAEDALHSIRVGVDDS